LVFELWIGVGHHLCIAPRLQEPRQQLSVLKGKRSVCCLLVLEDARFVLLKAKELLAELDDFTAAFVVDEAFFHGANFDLSIHRIRSNPKNYWISEL
jgi:hypothetical protein